MILLYWNRESDLCSGTELCTVIGFMVICYGLYWFISKLKE